ncbi:hypothetical protein AX14_001763 [Amanita brunnescens Koide BX004]|nr:hypothetical protein AX14_001763 [Amanita brunnescens Koide BX004]
MTVKKTFINSKNQKRSCLSISCRVLNPFRAPFDTIVANFNRRQVLLEGEAQHADREAENRNRQQEKIDKLLRILDFKAIGCEDKHTSSHQKVLPNTESGAWLLQREDYLDWRQADSRTGSAGLFWLLGQPGAGKTILASIVVEDLKSYFSTDAFVAYFYCDYKSDKKTLPMNILRSLLCQLISGFQPPLPPTVADLLETCSSASSPRTSLLTNIISKITNEYSTVSFVIDGMDECRDRAEILPELHQLSGCIRLFITSRDEDDIRESFQHYRKRELSISRNDTSRDIERLVVETVQNHIRAYPLFVKNPSIIDEIIQTVVGQADGMFLLVYFQLKNILECDSDARIREELGSLPRGLDETFVRALKRIHSHPSRERLRRLLRWVVCVGSLSLDSLFQAIAVDDMGDSWDPDRVVNDKRRLIKACAHLVTVTGVPEAQIVAFPHFSVYQFLTSEPTYWEETLPEYHFYPLPDAYKTIASCCAKFFSISNSPEPWQLIQRVVQRWRDHADFLDEASLLSVMFGASLKADPRPANSLLVFPRATYLEASNCTFVSCGENAYNIFTSMDLDSWFGGVTFSDIFPQVRDVTLNNCSFLDLASSHMNVYRGPVQAQFTPSSLDASHATTAKMEGYMFIHVQNSSWNIFPNEGVFRNERTSRDGAQVSFFENFRSVTVRGAELYDYTGFNTFFHNSILYSFST